MIVANPEEAFDSLRQRPKCYQTYFPTTAIIRSFIES